MDRLGIRLVLSFQLAQRRLQPSQQTIKTFGVECPVSGRVRSHLPSTACNGQDSSCCRLQRQLAHRIAVALVESPQGIVIRTLESGQPQIRYLVSAAASSLRHERTPVMNPYSHTPSSALGWYAPVQLPSTDLEFCPVVRSNASTNSATNLAGWSAGSSSSRLGGNIHICSRLIGRSGIGITSKDGPTPNSIPINTYF